MAKKKAFSPFVFLLDVEDDAEVTGGGTGQSTTDPYPCSFEEWQTLFQCDYDHDNDMDEDDYHDWFIDLFGQAKWDEMHPSIPSGGEGPDFIPDPETDPVAEMLEPEI